MKAAAIPRVFHISISLQIVVQTLAEVRPWKGSYVSVGKFQTLRDLRVVNCATEEQGLNIHLDKPSIEWDKYVWREMDRAFAEPVSRADDVADYAPTQALSEFFKLHGFDGVLYRSDLSKSGHNALLFDYGTVRQCSCQVIRVTDVTLDFEEASPLVIT